MSKFFKRIGTQSQKYVVDFYIEKVEFHLQQSCRLAISLKRGKHKKESLAHPQLKNGVAEFKETIRIPATMYFDKKKGKYQAKEATLTLNLLTTKAVRMAGVTKIDLAAFLNDKIGDKDLLLGVDKCFDKNAKFHMKVKMTSLDQSHKAGNDHVTNNNLLHHDDDDDDDDEEDTYNKDRAITQMDFRRSRSPGAQYMMTHDDSSDSHSTPSKGGGRRSNTVEAREATGGMKDFFSPKTIETKFSTHPATTEKVDQKGLSTPNSEITVVGPNSTATPLYNKIADLEQRNQELEKENSDLKKEVNQANEDQLKASQDFERIKAELDRFKSDSEASESTIRKKMEADLNNYKSRLREMENEITEMSSNYKKVVKDSQDLEKNNEDLLARLKKLEDSKSQSTETSSKNEELQQKIASLEQKLKTSEDNHKKARESYSSDVDNYSMKIEELQVENRKLRHDLTIKTNEVNDLESIISSQKDEIAILQKAQKLHLKSPKPAVSRTDDGEPIDEDSEDAEAKKFENQQVKQLTKKLEDLDKKYQDNLKKYKTKIDDLELKNNQLELELGSANNKLSDVRINLESKVETLQAENDIFKKQNKELGQKVTQYRYEVKDLEDIKKQLMLYEKGYKQLENDLMEQKMEVQRLENQKEQYEKELNQAAEINSDNQDKLEDIELELFKIKAQIADMVNAAFATGDAELLDRVEEILTANYNRMSPGGFNSRIFQQDDKDEATSKNKEIILDGSHEDLL